MDTAGRNAIIDGFRGGGRSALIPLLQAVQAAEGYLAPDALAAIAGALRVPLAEVCGVASFYAQFRFRPSGKITLRVCTGTACHVGGAVAIRETVEQELGIRANETTPDGMFTLETVACLGCCSLAPVLMANDTVYGRLTHDKVPALLKKLAAEQFHG